MQRLQVLATAAALFICCGQAPAPANPVLQHYHAYRAALAAQDVVTAEREADAALQASIQRDGNGGSTGVLAVNLAQLRLSGQQPETALESATLAQTIATQTPAAGVDALQARLLVGRAELASSQAMNGKDHLLAALAATTSQPDRQPDGYDAAVDLGQWAFAQNRFEDAIAAWEFAVRFSAQAPGDQDYARARALAAAGQAHFLFAVDRLNFHAQRADTRLSFDPADDYQAAADAFAQSADLMAPLAFSDQAGATITVAQVAYGEALAWADAMRAYIRTNNGRQPVTPPQPHDAAASQCELHTIAEPPPQFPSGANSRVVPGSVVLRILVNERGETTDRQIVAAVPGRWFKDAVERVSGQWRVEPTANSAQCEFPRVRYARVIFYFQ